MVPIQYPGYALGKVQVCNHISVTVVTIAVFRCLFVCHFHSLYTGFDHFAVSNNFLDFDDFTRCSAAKRTHIDLVGRSTDVANSAQLRHVTDTAVLTYWHRDTRRQTRREVRYRPPLSQPETIYTATSNWVWNDGEVPADAILLRHTTAPPANYTSGKQSQ